jgi:hypothetical protein
MDAASLFETLVTIFWTTQDLIPEGNHTFPMSFSDAFVVNKVLLFLTFEIMIIFYEYQSSTTIQYISGLITFSSLVEA